MEYNDIVGKEFGDLTVTSFSRREPYRNRYTYYYICECACGKRVEKVRSNLITGHTRSCGCRKERKGSKNKCWKGCGEISGRTWAAIKHKAEERGLEFDITIEDAWRQFEKQNGKCALTGMPISLSSHKTNYSHKTASLDRIDNTRGYMKNNIQWVHKDVNWMKGSFSIERFLDICRMVSEYAS